MSHPHDAYSGRPVPALPGGVSADAELLYRHLVRSGPDTTVGLAVALGMSSRRVALTIDELIEIGAVARQGGPRLSARAWVARSLRR